MSSGSEKQFLKKAQKSLILIKNDNFSTKLNISVYQDSAER